MVAKKKTSTRKPTAAQLAALKRGREKLAKQRAADKKKVREALKNTSKKIRNTHLKSCQRHVSGQARRPQARSTAPGRCCARKDWHLAHVRGSKKQ